jgi:molybdopterin-guanine dinucleotide biosynthesis protein A
MARTWPPAFDTILLAGGRAARLGGVDKPALEVAGLPMVVVVAAAACAAGTSKLVLVGPLRPELDQDGSPALPLLPPGGLVCVAEHPPLGGPVPALRRGLAEVAAPLVAVLAADLPFLRAADVRALLGPVASGSAAGAVLIDDAGRAQWLAGCWRTDLLLGALTGYAGGSMHGLLDGLAPERITVSRAAGQPPPWLDCDTPEDLALARVLAADRMLEAGEDVTGQPGSRGDR